MLTVPRLVALCALGLVLASAAPVVAAPPEPVPDNSLTVAAYRELGLPDPDRVWTGEDYDQALEVLQKAAESDLTRLPRYQSERSGAVFARLVAPENFASLRDESLPLEERYLRATGAMDGVARVAVLYLGAQSAGRIFDAEQVELFRQMMGVSRALFPLSASFLADLPADDANREARKAGFEEMQHGLAEVVGGALTAFTERDSYRTSELVRFSAMLESNLPELLPYLAEEVRVDVPARLRKLVEAEKDPDLKASLVKLEAVVAAAIAGKQAGE